MNNATRTEQTSNIKRSYIEKMQGENLHSQEEFIYQAKHAIWTGYENQDIPSNLLACFISDLERALLVAYQLGHKHGSKIGREKGFKESMEILLRGDRDEEN